MASKVGDLRIELSAETASFHRDMDKARSDIKSATTQMTKDMGAFKSSTSATSTAVLGLKTAVVAVATSAAAGMFLSTVTEFERLNGSLKTITGSSAQAEKEMKWLREFAGETPFQLSQVVTAFTKLKALGLEPSRAALESYGNTSAAMGKDLNQMIEAVADAATGEFERLKEFGIKAKSQGDQVSFTFQGVTTTVRKNAKEIEGYLVGIGKTKFAGAMADQMDSLNGQLSNLKDSTQSLMVAMGNTGIVGLLADVAEFVSKSIQGWTFLGKHISNQIYALRKFNEEQKKIFNEATPEQQDQMVNFDRRRATAAATSNAIISGPTKIGTVLPAGSLASQLSSLSGESPLDVKKIKEQAALVKQIYAELSKETKEATTLNQEMYEQLGTGAETVAKDEVRALMERAQKWQEAGANIRDINDWLYKNIEELRLKWAEKGEEEAVRYLDSFSVHAGSLIDEYTKMEQAAVAELDKIGIRMDLLDKQDINLDVYLRDHASSQIDAIVARVRTMRSMQELGLDISTTSGAAITKTININQSLSRSDVTNVITEANRQGDRG
jgi:hypothetical protein